MDLWTSDSTDSYIAILAHYIDPSWELKTKILTCYELEYPHTGEAIYQKLIAITNIFSISYKIQSVTTDNAANMVKGVQLFSRQLNENYGFTPIHYRCAAHILNIVVQKGNFKKKFTLCKTRQFVKRILDSPLLLNKLKKNQDDSNIALKPILDCPTRWNSTFEMLKRFVQLEIPFRKFVVEVSSLEEFFPNDEEIGEIRNLLELLKPFSIATKVLTQNKRCTMSYALVAFQGLKNVLHSHPHTNCLEMLQTLTRYAQNMEGSMLIPVFLDPQVRDEYFHGSMEEFLPIIRNIYNLYSVQLPNSFRQDESKDDSEKISYFARFINKRVRMSCTTTHEIDRYLSIHPTGEIDILVWWKSNSEEFPVLAMMAADFLGCQPTSAACERLFSLTKNMTDNTRNKLVPTTVEMITCLNKWKSVNY